eukprot:GHVS01008994.1.p1 GENE.GHVS01008994.1~~GHVS01008994.1.p1  ORF type:complete len:143 (-),score=45.68 GHVS01008994.1:188-616(-)
MVVVRPLQQPATSSSACRSEPPPPPPPPPPPTPPPLPSAGRRPDVPLIVCNNKELRLTCMDYSSFSKLHPNIRMYNATHITHLHRHLPPSSPPVAPLQQQPFVCLAPTSSSSSSSLVNRSSLGPSTPQPTTLSTRGPSPEST